jgi:DNA-binding transcriptional ArsR family regulator
VLVVRQVDRYQNPLKNSQFWEQRCVNHLTFILPMSDNDYMIETLSALAEPNRLAIVELLRDRGPRSVGDIAGTLALRQPLVSKHLKVLSDAGVVAARVDAQRRIYDLQEPRFREIDGWLDSFAAVWADRLGRLEAHLRSIEESS